MKDPLEIAQQIVLARGVYSSRSIPEFEMVWWEGQIAAAIQADREEREKEHQEALESWAEYAKRHLIVKAERDALQAKVKELQAEVESLFAVKEALSNLGCGPCAENCKDNGCYLQRQAKTRERRSDWEASGPGR